MPTPCIFCDNNSGSREHFWPRWIHKRHDFEPIKMERRGQEVVVIPNPELTVKTVCQECNNRWMSNLEAFNQAIIGRMVEDGPLDMNGDMQGLVAAWSVKTAMMSHSMKGRNASNKFYTPEECRELRMKNALPSRALVWIGRVDSMHLANVGTDFTFNDTDGNRLSTSSVCTIAVGHFIAQVVTVHIEQPGVTLESIPCKIGDWADSLIQIWPVQQQLVHWPPGESFTNGGPEGIAYLVDRWRLGEETDIIVPEA